MLRVFLVEDERIIRETLHATVPWARCGYQFVGEAADGEMALPMIRQTKPDVLITDIRMPFVDGLSLSRLVLQEFPQMKIIILSGYDDFEYAQQAISIGVERYLLKPIKKQSGYRAGRGAPENRRRAGPAELHCPVSPGVSGLRRLCPLPFL